MSTTHRSTWTPSNRLWEVHAARPRQWCYIAQLNSIDIRWISGASSCHGRGKQCKPSSWSIHIEWDGHPSIIGSGMQAKRRTCISAAPKHAKSNVAWVSRNSGELRLIGRSRSILFMLGVLIDDQIQAVRVPEGGWTLQVAMSSLWARHQCHESMPRLAEHSGWFSSSSLKDCRWWAQAALVRSHLTWLNPKKLFNFPSPMVMVVASANTERSFTVHGIGVPIQGLSGSVHFCQSQRNRRALENFFK